MATAAIPSKITEDDFICQICHDVLHNNPHSLPCLHNYCGDCVKQINRVFQNFKKGILCPVCKQFCKNKNIMPNNIIKSIVQEFANLDNKELLNKPVGEKVCRQCKETNVSAFCANCQCELCSACQIKHHNIVAIQDASNPLAIYVVKMCPIHPDNPIKEYCKPCKKAICEDCKLEDHDTHSTESVESALRVLIPEVQSELQSIKSRCDTMKEIRGKVDSINQDTTVNCREAIQQAESEMERKISKLRSDFSALQNEVLSKAPLKQGEMIKQDLDHTIGCMETLYTWVNTLTEVTQGPGVLHELQNELQGRLDAYAYNELDTREADDYIQNPPDQVVFTPTAVQNLVGKMEFKKKSDQYLSVKLKLQHQINVKQSEVEGKCVLNSMKSFRYTEENFSNCKKKAPKELYSFKHKHRFLRFCYFNAHIWTACTFDDCIDVYTIEGECIRTILCTSIQRPEALHPLTLQKMLVAADNGLYIVDVHTGNTESQIIPGWCRYIHVTEACIAVLEKGKDGTNDSVHILNTTAPYGESAHFSLKHNRALTLLVHGGHIYISAWDPYDNITKYDMNGEQLEQYGEPGRKQPGKLHHPRLCLTDSSGSILVADDNNNRLQLLSCGQWSVVKGVKIREPTDVFVAQGQMYISSWHYKQIQVYQLY